MNKGLVYALWSYEAQNSDELSFREGDAITILRRKDENETEWWWARLGDREGYVPKNLLGVSTLGLGYHGDFQGTHDPLLEGVAQNPGAQYCLQPCCELAGMCSSASESHGLILPLGNRIPAPQHGALFSLP